MRAILSDHDIEGQFNSLVALLKGPELSELWNSFGLETFLMRDVGLSHNTPDREIWNFCQTEQYVLITGNRNLDDSNSLEQTMRDSATESSLPILTISSIRRFERDPSYRMAGAWRLLEVLMDIDRCRGAGRQFLP